DGVVPVAEAADRLDRYVRRRFWVELAPQIANVELHLVAGDAVRVAPDELQQLVAAEDLSRMAHQRRQELELERRQRDVTARVRHGALPEVDRHQGIRVALRRVTRPRPRSPQERLHARDEL